MTAPLLETSRFHSGICSDQIEGLHHGFSLIGGHLFPFSVLVFLHGCKGKAVHVFYIVVQWACPSTQSCHGIVRDEPKQAAYDEHLQPYPEVGTTFGADDLDNMM